MKQIIVGLGLFMGCAAAGANPYVSAKIGVTDFIVDANQYMYHTPDAYRSTVVDGDIDDINAAYRVAVGYRFDEIRLEAEYGFSHHVMSGNWALNTKNGVPGSLPPNLSYPATYSLKSNINTFMINAYHDVFTFGERYSNALYNDINMVEPCCRNAVYLTAGLGMTHISEKAHASVDTTMAWGGDAITERDSASINRFTYGFGAGLDLAINRNITADISYKYLRMGRYEIGDVKRKYYSHSVMLGLRYEF